MPSLSVTTRTIPSGIPIRYEIAEDANTIYSVSQIPVFIMSIICGLNVIALHLLKRYFC